jgi:ubiquitin carboxyl-terminal hydrolase 34
LDLLTNVKISSKFSFPNILNLKNFIHEDQLKENQEKNINDSDYEYKLVGVVIHRGNADYGHYTSLINVNRNDPNRPELNED